MEHATRRSKGRSLKTILPAVLTLTILHTSCLGADPVYADAYPDYPARSADEALVYRLAAYSDCIVREPGFGPVDHGSGTRLKAGYLSHPLVNLPPAYRAEGELYTGASRSTGGGGITPGINGVAHLVDSHVTSVVRPVTSVTKLLSLIVYNGLDALRQTPRPRIPSELPPPLRQGPGMDLAAWEKELDEITRSRSSTGTLEPLIDGAEFFTRLEETVAKAGDSVHIQTYIFDNDDYALEFGKLLKERSREMDVKVLIDGLGSIMASGVNHESLPDGHTAPQSLLRYLRENSSIKVRRLANPWLTFDHTKSMVVDRSVAFVGGMNIGREYRHVWHDMMVQVEGPVVAQLQEDFTRTWNYAGIAGDLALITSYGEKTVSRPKSPVYPVRVLRTRIGHSQIYRAHLAAIKRAESYIYIENPYLSDDVVLDELIMARHRGVDVRVILPLECNWKPMKRSNVLAANRMLANGIKVYMYPGMSHVKAAVIDGWACLGSANMDKASLRLNREVNLATSHPPFVKTLISRLFKADFEQSIALERPLREKISDRLYETVADLL